MSYLQEGHFFKSMRGKVIVAFLAGVIAIALSWVVTRVAFSEMLETVDELSKPNEKLRIVNRLFRHVTQLDRLQTAEALRNPDKPYEIFSKETQRLLHSIDTLRDMSRNNVLQLERIDSMKNILHERDMLFVRYLTLRSELVDNKTFSSQVQLLTELVADSQTDSTIITSEQTFINILQPDDSIAGREGRQPVRAFFSRLFGKRKAEDEISKILVREELLVTTDTLILAKQDSLMNAMEMVIRNMETEQRVKVTRLMTSELDLYNTGNILINKLLTLLHEMEEEEILQIELNHAAANKVFHAGVQRMAAIVIVFFLLAALLSWLMLSDLSKSNLYRKKLEEAKAEAERLSNVKQRFLANMSHEIRTPLQSILGFTEQLRSGKKFNAKHLDAIHSSSEHLLQIVNEVLDYTRIESGRIMFDVQHFNLPDLLSEIAASMSLQAAGKKIDFQYTPPVLPQDNYSGDPFRLRQILYNLLGNAIKFTDAGKVVFEVSAENSGNKTRFTFQIKDTGSGIAEEDVGRIFNVFEQACNNLYKPVSGTGLGLAITKSLVESQGGTINVKSKAGEGSCFTVQLEFEKAKTAVPAAKENNNGLPVTFAGKILIVDDDELILELCSAIFKKHGIVHTCFSSPEKLLNEKWQSDVRLIFIDIRLPGMSGIELCKILRNTVAANVKIIALTAQAFPEERAAILKDGFDGLLLKPFREHELLAFIKVNAAISKKPIPKQEMIFSAIREMAEDEKDFEKIMRQFIHDTQSDLKTLELQIQNENSAEACEVIHRLAGRTGQAGIKDLATQLRLIEIALRQQQPLVSVLNEIQLVTGELKKVMHVITEKISAETLS